MYLEETAAYLDNEKKERILEELYHNAYRTIKSVYMFEHFYEYVTHLYSNEEKKEVYWKASYYDKLIDLVKISIAFETYNKAVLLSKGILVHKIKRDRMTKDYANLQMKGVPIIASEIVSIFGTNKNHKGKIFLNGLNDYFQTITYSETLNERYQKIIGLDNTLVNHLRKINEDRNRLHFFTDFKGGFKVSAHIAKWQYIMRTSIDIIEYPFKNKGILKEAI